MMDATNKKVKQFISDNQLLGENAKVVVGLSGGADSIALIYMLHQLGYDCIAAHCNFHLRGEESDRDQLFVETFCKTYEIELFVIDFDTVGYAKERSISIEMAARELRYTWFEKIRAEQNASAIAVAHHADDSAETVLLNLIRGTGIRGLTGIVAKNGKIIRPLLTITRNDIETYLERYNLTYIVDSTNNENIYTRNKIRLDVIPLLETINPSVSSAINSTARHLCQVENIYLKYIEQAISYVKDGNRISIEKLKEKDEPEAILFEMLNQYGFNSDTIENIYESLDRISGKQFYSSSHRLIKDRDFLILEEWKQTDFAASYFINETDTEILDPIHLEIDNLVVNENFTIEKSADIAYLDKAKLRFPLQLRRWQLGDWFIPLGMKGKRKLSDYFKDQKFTLVDKENVWLLCSGDDIVWIVGHRTDDRYKITDKTKSVFRLTLKK